MVEYALKLSDSSNYAIITKKYYSQAKEIGLSNSKVMTPTNKSQNILSLTLSPYLITWQDKKKIKRRCRGTTEKYNVNLRFDFLGFS